MSGQHKSYFSIRFEDLPDNEPILKMKRGMWYRDKNTGYTDTPLEAGLYTKAEAKGCFDENGENGDCGVYAVPIRKALDEHPVTIKRINAIRAQLAAIEKYASDFDTTIF